MRETSVNETICSDKGKYTLLPIKFYERTKETSTWDCCGFSFNNSITVALTQKKKNKIEEEKN